MADEEKRTGYLLCSKCFQNEGLYKMAEEIGVTDTDMCRTCRNSDGKKLTKYMILDLAYAFFVWGTFHRTHYGGAPILQFNKHHVPSEKEAIPEGMSEDVKRIEEGAEIGLFRYGPRFWMIGEIEPLKALIGTEEREKTIDSIFEEYPTVTLPAGEKFYRLRKNPRYPEEPKEYDSAPGKRGTGRLDSEVLPIMYASQNIDICIHECRVRADDNVYVATLTGKNDMKLLDLMELLPNEDEFTSLDMAIHMIFLAEEHSYEVCRMIATRAYDNGYDGIIYPSYFSLLQTGAIPFETVLGMSTRTIAKLTQREKAKTIRNLGLFGRPIENNKVDVLSINRIILRKVIHQYHFGPVVVDSDGTWPDYRPGEYQLSDPAPEQRTIKTRIQGRKRK